ncbi:hypothetical protein ERUR111494_02895 [Erysipelothrix urinaevulpis]
MSYLDISSQLAIIGGFSTVSEESFKFLLGTVLLYAIMLYPYQTLKFGKFRIYKFNNN